MTLSYSFRTGLKSLYREKWINLLSTLTVASSLLIITLTIFFLYNIELVADRLPERFSLIAYMKTNLSNGDINNIIETLKKREDVTDLKYISKEDALNEMKQVLKDSGHILNGLDENPLPPSVELKLKKDLITSVGVKKIAEEIKKIPGIDDVYSGEKIAEAIHVFKKSARNLSIIIFLTVSAGVVFVTYSTVKILFYRRKEEIEIFKLLGATGGFIRMPFLVEGGVIGFAGGLLGIIGALIFYFGITYRLSLVIPMLKTLVFPAGILMLPPIAGISMGITGALIAIGRLRL